MSTNTEKKSFGTALLVWFFLGGFGGHRIYIKEKMSVALWYWLANICTLGILAIVDAFLLKGMIQEANQKVDNQTKLNNL
jgi:TM2 domain-containing membrane protein YozV